MAHTPAWHAEYLRLENAACSASIALREARKAMDRKRRPAGAEAVYEAALEASRIAGKARWDFEMTGAVVVDVATLPTAEFFAALRPSRGR